MNALVDNMVFHTLNEAIKPVQEPSLNELLAELTADLEDAEAHLYAAENISDPFKWTTERDRWQRRIAALRRHIKALEGSF